MKTIPLTKGYEAIVDDEDYEFLMKWKWHALISPSGNIYAERCERPLRQKIKHIMMHRVINQTPEGFKTDHRNGNGLDNRRHNLRTATHSQNMMNRRPNVKGSSRYKGVSWHKQHRKWCAVIQGRHIGLFVNEREAALAYAARAAEKFGEFNREIIYV